MGVKKMPLFPGRQLKKSQKSIGCLKMASGITFFYALSYHTPPIQNSLFDKIVKGTRLASKNRMLKQATVVIYEGK